MTYRCALAICLGVTLTASSAQAHHAWAAVFTEETMEIEGVVTEYNFKNPHVNIMLSVIDETGVETEWMATGPAAPPFRRWGWTEDTVAVGQYLQLTGRKSRTGAPMIVMVGSPVFWRWPEQIGRSFHRYHQPTNKGPPYLFLLPAP